VTCFTALSRELRNLIRIRSQSNTARSCLAFQCGINPLEVGLGHSPVAGEFQRRGHCTSPSLWS